MDVVAHFKPEEIQQMDALQGGADTQKYGAPYYGKLWEIIQSNPEIKEKTAKAVQELMALPVKEAEDITQNLKELTFKKLGTPENQLVQPPQNTEALKLASEGEDGDTEIAFMPSAMLDFLWDLYPDEIPIEERINEDTGLPEFGFLDFILPVIGGVVGSIIPGVGTALGAGIGGGISGIGSALGGGEKGIGSSIGSALGSVGGSLIPGLGIAGTAAGGMLGGLAGGMFDQKSQLPNTSQYGDIAEYNKYIKEARERDRERINKFNTQAENYTNNENKRLSQYQQDINQHRLNEIAAEKQYHGDRSKMIKAYNARYHPLIDPQLISDMVDKYGVL